MDECQIFQLVMWYLFIFSKLSLTFLNFNFARILPVFLKLGVMLGESCLQISLCANNESQWRALFMGSVKHVS